MLIEGQGQTLKHTHPKQNQNLKMIEMISICMYYCEFQGFKVTDMSSTLVPKSLALEADSLMHKAQQAVKDNFSSTYYNYFIFIFLYNLLLLLLFFFFTNQVLCTHGIVRDTRFFFSSLWLFTYQAVNIDKK